MDNRPSSASAFPATLVSGVSAALQWALRTTLLLAPSVFGNLHRFGSFDLLLVVCLLMALHVVSALVGDRLWHVRTWANLAMWGLMGLALAQVLPLPRDLFLGTDAPGLEALEVLLDGPAAASRPRGRGLGVVRFSMRPTATLGVVILLAAAGGTYWLTSSASTGRKRLRRTTWAVLIGSAVPAFWVIAETVRRPALAAHQGASFCGPALILGGDSLVPMLLAAVPLGLAIAIRVLAWMPRKPPHRRQSRWGWLGRSGTVSAWLAVLLAGLAAAGLGMSNVPRHLLAAVVALSAVFVLGGHALSRQARSMGRRPAVTAAALAVWVAAAAAMGSAIGRQRQEAYSAAGQISALAAAIPPARRLFGTGLGSISPRATYGASGWPEAPGDDGDTSGWLLLRVEAGSAGVLLVGGLALGLAALAFRAWRSSGSPRSRTLVAAGLGALAANAAYFFTDASALLVPNLLVLAAAAGITAAWAVHGARQRPAWAGAVSDSHWPLVLGAVGLVGALGLAETEMLAVAEGAEFSDKVLHFGTFAVVSLLVCYALGPRPETRHLKTRIAGAVLGAAVLGAATEFAQRYLTGGRAFERLDIVANVLGAGLMGILFWIVRSGQASGAERRPED